MFSTKSKQKFQRQLNRAWAPDLVQRIETAVRAATSQPIGQSLRSVTEKSAGQAIGRVRKIRVVQDVEEFAPESNANLLADAERSLDVDVGLRGVKATQHVASEVSLLSRGCCDEGRL